MTRFYTRVASETLVHTRYLSEVVCFKETPLWSLRVTHAIKKQSLTYSFLLLRLWVCQQNLSCVYLICILSVGKIYVDLDKALQRFFMPTQRWQQENNRISSDFLSVYVIRPDRRGVPLKH